MEKEKAKEKELEQQKKEREEKQKQAELEREKAEEEHRRECLRETSKQNLTGLLPTCTITEVVERPPQINVDTTASIFSKSERLRSYRFCTRATLQRQKKQLAGLPFRGFSTKLRQIGPQLCWQHPRLLYKKLEAREGPKGKASPREKNYMRYAPLGRASC